jgi:DNA relaxase NicK
MTDITSRIHWLAFTVHAENSSAFVLYDALFKSILGPIQPFNSGGRGFKQIYHNILGFKIYTEPAMGTNEYFSYEIPGEACDCIPWDYFQALGDLLESNYKDKYKFTRMDYAFDQVPFEPYQVKEAIMANQIRSLAKRKSLQIHESPFTERDNYEIGTYTVDFGSRSSERMIRVYNKRGFTRLEMEIRDKRADLVAKQILALPDDQLWFTIAQAHLLDFIDFETPWWHEFASSNKRAGATVSKPGNIAFDKTFQWLDKQVSPSLSVAYELLSPEVFQAMINRGKRRSGSKFDLLKATYHPENFDGKGPREGIGSHQSFGGDE